MLDSKETSAFLQVVSILMIFRHSKDESGTFLVPTDEAAALVVSEAKAIVDEMKKQDCLGEPIDVDKIINRAKGGPNETG